MSIVFLDTVGLIALWDATDQWHDSARKAMESLDVPGTRLTTSSYILLECGNAATRKPYRSDVCLLRDQFLIRGDLISPTEADIDQAWAEYLRRSAADAGIIDHVSFVVMRRLGITDVFTNDRHFKAAGFNTLF